MAEAAPLAARVAVADLETRFQALVLAHRDRAVGLAWRLTGGDRAAAEDVAQNAFVRAYRSLASFRGDAELGTWFYRIVVREAHRYRRWRSVREAWRRLARHEAPPYAAPSSGDPPLRRRIAAALDRLSPAQREVFVLVHLEGFTVREVAELFERAEGTVKSHLARALRLLRRELADLRPVSEGTQR